MNSVTHKVFLLLISGFILLPRAADAADVEFKSRLVVSEEYNDNILDTKTNKKTEFITRAMPGFSLKYFAKRLDLDSSYNFDYRYYAKGTKGDEYTHNLLSKATLSLIENFFFVQLSDSYKRVTLDVARDNTDESLFVNQSDQNIGVISPYLVWRVGSNSTIKTGYRYTNTWYKEPSGVDKREHYAFADASHELLSGFFLTWGYSFSDTNTSVNKFERHNAYGGFRYEYANKSFIFGKVGNTWQSFDTRKNISNVFWDAGLTHEFPIVTATLESKVQYSEDPLRSSIKETVYSGKFERALERGSLVFSGAYSEFEITETGVTDSKRVSLRALGKYEITDNLKLSLSVLGDRFNQKTPDDYPYRLTGIAGVSYSFNDGLIASLSYTHITNRNQIFETAGSKDINRYFVQLEKSF
jgi:hypothetical protein